MMALFLKMLFCVPKRVSSSDKVNYADGSAYSVRFLFSDCTRLTSVGGEKSLAAMIATLCVAVEQEYGFLVSRLFRVFKPHYGSSKKSSFKSMCGIPYFLIVLLIVLLIAISIALVTVYKVSSIPVNAVLITFVCVIGLSFITNLWTWAQAGMALINSQKSRVVNAAEQVDHLKIDGFMHKLKSEIDLMSKMVNCMDNFTDKQTRLVVVVDGLDSCEQEKVLQVLDTVNSLFSDDNSPFITILAVDPHVIIKGIEQNLSSKFDSNVNGYDYLRNVVHIPFYLQSQGVRIPKQNLTGPYSSETSVINAESPGKPYMHQESKSSTSIGHEKTRVKNKLSSMLSESLPGMNYASSVDLSHTFVKNDYFSDINPRSMRRLMNIVAVTARLLRAYHIEFNWHRLAAWINIIEQWPYRVSWIIYYFEEADCLDNSTSLHTVYEKISLQIPASKDIDPLLEIDRNVRKLEAFLASKSGNTPLLNVGDLKKFLGCTINLDPYLRKLIREFQSNAERMEFNMPGIFPHGVNMPSRDSEANLLSNRLSGKPINVHGTPTRLPVNMAYANSFMQQYGQNYSAPMQGMMPMMGAMPAASVASWPTNRPPPQVFLKDFNSEFHLSQMSVIDICHLLSKLSGVNQAMLSQYAVAIRENNITGLVLANCDIDELGKVMEMKFGDWQLLKAAILSLRESEVQSSTTNVQNRFSDGVLYRKPVSPTKFNSTFSEADLTRRRASMGTLRKSSLISGISTDDDIAAVKSRFRRNDSIVQQLSLETAILREALEEFTEEGLVEEMDGPEKAMFNLASDEEDEASKQESVSTYVKGLEHHPLRSYSCPSPSQEQKESIYQANDDTETTIAVLESAPSNSTDHRDSHSSIAKSISTSIEKLTKPIVHALESVHYKDKQGDTIPLVGMSASSSSESKGSNTSSEPAVLTIESDLPTSSSSDKRSTRAAMEGYMDYFSTTIKPSSEDSRSPESQDSSTAGPRSEYFL